MAEAARRELEEEIRRFRLAQSDMEQVEAACEWLQTAELSGGVERVVITGIVVTYARCFTKDSERQRLGEEWAPGEPTRRELHDNLIHRRDTLYAHTDKTDARRVYDTSALLGDEGGPSFAEAYRPFNPGFLPAIAKIARAQAHRFRDAADEREQALA